MGKKETATEYWVRVEPRHLGDFGTFLYPDEDDRMNDYKDRCESVITEIRRHVDGVGNVYLVAAKEWTCEFCGATWSEVGDKFNGGCCDEDMENAPEGWGEDD